MRYLLGLLIVAGFAGAPALTAAKDVDGEFAVFSVGGKRCADYLRARGRGGRALAEYTTWMQGYLSAFNLIVINTYDILGEHDFQSAVGWLDQHCGDNRDALFVNATAALTVNLFPARRNMGPGKDNRARWSSGPAVDADAAQ